jgi:hypothetical protein
VSEIKSKKIEIVDINEIKPNPKNRNIHSTEQIDRLCEIIKYQGFRIPLVVSNRSGFLVSGHGRLEAAKKLGLKKLPVIYQDFDSEEQEYASQVSDNAIAAWASLDLSGINSDLGDLGPEFDINMLGISGFTVDFFEKDNLSNQKKYKDQADKLLSYLESEIRTLRLTYNESDYAEITRKLDEYCKDNGLDNYSDAVKMMVLG